MLVVAHCVKAVANTVRPSHELVGIWFLICFKFRGNSSPDAA